MSTIHTMRLLHHTCRHIVSAAHRSLCASHNPSFLLSTRSFTAQAATASAAASTSEQLLTAAQQNANSPHLSTAPSDAASKEHVTYLRTAQSAERADLLKKFPATDFPHPDNIERPTERVLAVVEMIHNLTMFEGLQLAKLLKEKYGIPSGVLSAGAVGVAPAGGVAAAAAPAEEEDVVVKKTPKAAPVQTMFAVKLVGFEQKDKIKVIKEIRQLTGLGLKESKDLVESAPKVIKKDLDKQEAEALQKKLQDAGAKVALE